MVNFLDHPAFAVGKGKSVPLSPSKYKELIMEGVSILQEVNSGMDVGILPFTVLGDIDTPNPKSFWFKVRCPYCGDLLNLCPPKKNLEANLRNHLGSSKHILAVEAAKKTITKFVGLLCGRRGRPSRLSSTSAHSNQPDLHSWFSGRLGCNQEGTSFTSGLDSNVVKTLMCWGFRDLRCFYNRLSYGVRGLLEDHMSGGNWFSEPHLVATVTVNRAAVYINGAFRHKDCAEFAPTTSGFTNLTCSKCTQIPQENDFTKRVVIEDRALDKRGTRTIGGGRRIEYLTVAELVCHGRDMRKKLRSEALNHWATKARIVQRKVKRPTLKEMAKESSSEHNLIKFCNNILNAHRIGAFGSTCLVGLHERCRPKSQSRQQREPIQ